MRCKALSTSSSSCNMRWLSFSPSTSLKRARPASSCSRTLFTYAVSPIAIANHLIQFRGLFRVSGCSLFDENGDRNDGFSAPQEHTLRPSEKRVTPQVAVKPDVRGSQRVSPRRHG